MLNVASMTIKPYQFADGDKVYTLDNPSQELFISIQNANGDMEVFENIWKTIVPDKYPELLEYDVLVKIEVIKDYFKFHGGQLQEKFPSSITTQEE